MKILYCFLSYLNVRGAPTPVYAKVELVAKRFSASEMNMPIMSTAEQKQSVFKYYNKSLQEYGLSDPLKVVVIERKINIYD